MGLLDGISSSYNVMVKFGLDNAAFLKGLKQVEAATQRIGKNLTRNLTLPIIALGTATVNASLKMNTAMSNVETLIPGATERVIELKKEVQDLALVTGKATSEMTAGLYEVISAFGDTEETMARVEANARLAVAGFSSITEAVNFTSAATKGYGDISAAAIQKVSDLGLLTVRLGKTTFPALSGSIGRLTGNAKALGISLEELMAIYATLTGVTGDTTRVTTQADAAMRAFMKPIPGMAAAIKKLGFEGSEALVGEKGLVGALRAVLETTDGSVEAVGKLVESTEAFPLIFAVAGAQADVFDSKLMQMNDSLGTTDEAFKAATEGINAAGHTWNQFKVRIEVIAQRLGDKLMPAFTKLLNDVLIPFLEKIGEWIIAFTELDPWTQKVILGVIALTAALGPLLIGIGWLTTALKGLIVLFSGPYGWIALLVAAGVAIFSLEKKKKALREEAARMNKEIKLSEARLNNFKKEVEATTEKIDEHRKAKEKDTDAFKELRDQVVALMEKYPDYREELGFTIGDSGDLYDVNGNLIDSYSDLQTALDNFSTASVRREYLKLATDAVAAWRIQSKTYIDWTRLLSTGTESLEAQVKKQEAGFQEANKVIQLYLGQLSGGVSAEREDWVRKDLERTRKWAEGNRATLAELALRYHELLPSPAITKIKIGAIEEFTKDYLGWIQEVAKREPDVWSAIQATAIGAGVGARDGDGDGDRGPAGTEDDPIVVTGEAAYEADILRKFEEVHAETERLFAAARTMPSFEQWFKAQSVKDIFDAILKIGRALWPAEQAPLSWPFGMGDQPVRKVGEQPVLGGDTGMEFLFGPEDEAPIADKVASKIQSLFDSIKDALLDSAAVLGRAIGSGGDIGQALTSVFNMLGNAISEKVSSMITSSIGGTGLFGSIVGAFGGGIVSGLFSLVGGLFGGGKSKAGTTESEPIYASITNWDQFFKFGFTLPATFLLSGRSREFDLDPHGRSVDGLRDERRTDMHYNH